jgi:hypothetical protein
LKIFRYNKSIGLTQQQLDVLFSSRCPAQNALDFLSGNKSKEKYSGKSIRRGSIIEAMETSDRECHSNAFWRSGTKA